MCFVVNSRNCITSSAIDRLLFVGLYALVPSVLDALQIVKPDTVIHDAQRVNGRVHLCRDAL